MKIYSKHHNDRETSSMCWLCISDTLKGLSVLKHRYKKFGCNQQNYSNSKMQQNLDMVEHS